jgi:hypothetical protein
MLAAHGVTPFPVPQILGAITGGLAAKSKALSAGNEAGMRLQSELPAESFQTRTPALEPTTYEYKDQDQVYSAPKPAPSGPEPIPPNVRTI